MPPKYVEEGFLSFLWNNNLYQAERRVIGVFMQSITVTEKNANMKIEKLLQALYPNLSFSTLQKAFRKRDIKANGIRVGKDYLVMPGDKLEIYIVDNLLFRTGKAIANVSQQNYSIVYEDENILLVNKAQGIPVHPDKGQSGGTLIDLVRDYLQAKNGHILNKAQFQPSLCHRLDRNTGGLVLIAKNEISYSIILKKLESREIKKYYQCLAKGKMEKKEAVLKAYLWKGSNKSRVFVSEHKMPGSREIITAYRVLKYDSSTDVSHLGVELVTGRTHQIRAHLSFIGHPILGDGKYGSNAVNRAFGRKYQALWACHLEFAFAEGNTPLSYLNGKKFTVDPGF